MKKIQIILLAAVSLLWSSCGEDFLNRRPSNAISTEVAITNVREAGFAVNGVYDALSSVGYYNGAIFYYGDIKGDDMQSKGEEGGRLSHRCYMFEHQTNNLYVEGLWSQPFYVIRLASNVIEAFDGGKVMDGDMAVRNDLKGQAYALRALAHFDLVRCFGYPYLKDGGASWGVPIVDHPLKVQEALVRNTVAECYDFIIGQLKIAIPLLSADRNNGKINAYAARALLARVYLYSNQNKEAFETARDLIEELKANGQYSLFTRDEYLSQWSLEAKFNKESLFEISNLATDNPGMDGLSNLMHWYGYNSIILTKQFADDLLSDPNDIRQGLIEQVTDQNILKWWLKKYPGAAADKVSYENNYPVIRLSEVYLIAAEAGYKTGGEYTSTALGYLNEIVSRANPDKEVSVVEFNTERVLLERRKELVGEGHRFFDALRNGVKLIRKGGYHLTGAPEEIDWNYYKCVLPIPAAQFQLNPEMQQNPEYSRQ